MHSLFSIICGLLWKDSNFFVFANGHNCVKKIFDTSILWAGSYTNPGVVGPQLNPSASDIYWSPLENSWVKLNTD